MENIQYPEYHEGATAIMSVYIRMWVLLDVTYRHTNHKTMKVKIIFKKWIVRCVSTVHLVLSVVFLISFRQQFLPMCLVYDFSLNDLLSPSNFFLSGFFFCYFFSSNYITYLHIWWPRCQMTLDTVLVLPLQKNSGLWLSSVPSWTFFTSGSRGWR